MDMAKRADDVIFEVTGGRAVLLDGAGAELITLNPVGTLVWQALDGRRDVTTLARDLQPRFDDVDLDRLTGDIVGFVSELESLGLVIDAAG
jgi:hypothetical protein